MAAGILVELCYIDFVISQNNEPAILNYIVIYLIASIIVFGTYFYLRKSKSTGSKRRELYLIISFSILFRITLIPTELSTSEDVYRYLWEGKVVAHGLNPFEHPPESPKLTHLHSKELPSEVAFKNMTAIYPPAAQYVFAISYILFGESITGMKIIYLIAEVLTVLFIVLLLRHKNIDERFVILYAWLPLPVMEYFINAHIDPVGIMFFVLFVLLFLKDKYYFSAAAFSLAVLTKMYPVVFIPLVYRKLGWKKSFYFTFICIITAFLFYIPFIPDERGISEALFKYVSHWSFNGSVFKIFYFFLQHNQQARLISYILFGLTILYITYRNNEFLKSIYLIWIAYIIFTPTLYPWYLGWIAAINPVFSFASVNSLLLTIGVSNFTPLSDKWTEYWWTLLIQYVPFYCLLIYDYLKNRENDAVEKTENA